MEMTIQPHDEKVSIEIVGSIDENGAETLKRRFLEMDVVKLQEVTFDFSGVTFIGSAGIGKLLLFYKNLATHGARSSSKT